MSEEKIETNMNSFREKKKVTERESVSEREKKGERKGEREDDRSTYESRNRAYIC